MKRRNVVVYNDEHNQTLELQTVDYTLLEVCGRFLSANKTIPGESYDHIDVTALHVVIHVIAMVLCFNWLIKYGGLFGFPGIWRARWR